MPLLAAGEFALASEHLEVAVAGPTIGWGPRDARELYVMLADLAGQRRDPAALQRYVPLAEAAARHYGHKLYLGIALRAQGVEKMLSEDYGCAEANLGRALAIFEELGTLWQIGRTRLELGRLAAARGDTRMTQAHYACAVESFMAIRAEPDTERARQLLAALSQTTTK